MSELARAVRRLNHRIMWRLLHTTTADLTFHSEATLTTRPIVQLFPGLKSDLAAAEFRRMKPNLYFRDAGQMREFVQFQRDMYSTVARVGVVVNVAAVDRKLWEKLRQMPGQGWRGPEPDSPDYPELDSNEIGWRDRPELDFTYFDGQNISQRDVEAIRGLVRDGIAMIADRSVDAWIPPT